MAEESRDLCSFESALRNRLEPHSGRLRQQVSHPHQVVSCRRQGEHPSHLIRTLGSASYAARPPSSSIRRRLPPVSSFAGSLRIPPAVSSAYQSRFAGSRSRSALRAALPSSPAYAPQIPSYHNRDPLPASPAVGCPEARPPSGEWAATEDRPAHDPPTTRN